eukprot:263142-Prymnesium_polylepis.1
MAARGRTRPNVCGLVVVAATHTRVLSAPLCEAWRAYTAAIARTASHAAAGLLSVCYSDLRRPPESSRNMSVVGPRCTSCGSIMAGAFPDGCTGRTGEPKI